MSVDAAFEKLALVLADARPRMTEIQTEEDAKLQLITRIMIEVLGWEHRDLLCEEPNPKGFSDYKVMDAKHIAYILEAKRIGKLNLKSASAKKGYYKLSGPVLTDCSEGVTQVANYCHELGSQLAVLTDGCIWIIFLPWIANANFRSKQAIVFPGIDSLESSFSEFFELLSKRENRKSTYRVIFDRLHENRLVLDRALVAPISASENFRQQKSALAFDIETTFDNFFDKLAGDRDPDMLVECFVESRDSIIADYALDRITRNVLGNIQSQEESVEAGLQSLVRDTVAGDRGETIFIVGPPGAGKSTFLERFFSRTLPAEIRARCISVYINSLDSSGTEEGILHWITEKSISEIEKQIYKDGFPANNDLLGLYHLEYLKRAKSSHARLYERDKEAFKDDFAIFMQDAVAKDREGYLQRLLRDIVNNRKMLPIFIIDNTDEFDLDYRVKIFQYSQAIRRAITHCLLVFPVTDKSAWTFSKTEVFNIYASRSFFLPSPPAREIFRKRTEYLKRKLGDDKDSRQSATYLAGRGIRVTISNLHAFANIVETTFVDQDYTAKRIGELSNYNVRKILSLSKRVLTSAVLNLEDLVRSFATGTTAAPSAEKFSQALLKGDYELFRPGDEPSLFPIFQVDVAIRQSPLLHLRMLELLRGLHSRASEDVDRYISVESATSYFGLMGVSEIALQRSIETLLQGALIEPYDASQKDFSNSLKIAVSYSGLAHLDMAFYNPIFVTEMALTTRILDAEVAEQIRDAYRSTGNVEERLERVRKVFSQYLIDEDGRLCTVPNQSDFDVQKAVAESIKLQWNGPKFNNSTILHLPTLAAEKTTATVVWFDKFKGFGFVEVPLLKDNAFIHARVAEQAGHDEIRDGDELICDISRNEKGLVVSSIYQVPKTKPTQCKCHIVKLLPDRSYGFVHVPEKGVDAFFHYKLVSPEDRKALHEGQSFLAEIKTDGEGRSQVRSFLAS